MSAASKFEPYEGNLFTLKQCEVDCSGAHLSNCVQFDYSVTVKADPSVSGQEYVNRVLEREVGLFQQSLSLLLMRPSHLITYEAKLDGVGVKYKPFPQHAPLGLYSLASMWRRLPDPLGYIALVRTTALTIYGIRNNLFHGVYDPDSENDQKHISTAEHLLSPLVRELIAKEMLGKSPPIMKLVSEETLNG